MLQFLSLFFLLCYFCYNVLSFPLTKRASGGLAIESSFPDPAFIQVNGTYYAFATNGGGFHIPMASSTDFTTWTLSDSDPLPKLPAWAGPNNIWAPDVIQLPGDGGFVMYFAAENPDTSTHCIAVATSSSPTGPYEPVDEPFVCEADRGGAIDPAAFYDSDSQALYLVYKVDGNSLGGGGQCGNGDGSHPTPIMMQKLSADGTKPDGDAEEILDRDDNDGPLIEAPSLTRSKDGTYVLFFSSNCYNGKLYDISYATASAVTGPYEKVHAPDAPLLQSGDDVGGGKLSSPGGADVDVDGSKIVFHADEKEGDPGVRQMWTASITIENGVVKLVDTSGPSDTS